MLFCFFESIIGTRRCTYRSFQLCTVVVVVVVVAMMMRRSQEKKRELEWLAVQYNTQVNSSQVEVKVEVNPFDSWIGIHSHLFSNLPPRVPILFQIPVYPRIEPSRDARLLVVVVAVRQRQQQQQQWMTIVTLGYTKQLLPCRQFQSK